MSITISGPTRSISLLQFEKHVYKLIKSKFQISNMTGRKIAKDHGRKSTWERIQEEFLNFWIMSALTFLGGEIVLPGLFNALRFIAPQGYHMFIRLVRLIRSFQAVEEVAGVEWIGEEALTASAKALEADLAGGATLEEGVGNVVENAAKEEFETWEETGKLGDTLDTGMTEEEEKNSGFAGLRDGDEYWDQSNETPDFGKLDGIEENNEQWFAREIEQLEAVPEAERDVQQINYLKEMRRRSSTAWTNFKRDIVNPTITKEQFAEDCKEVGKELPKGLASAKSLALSKAWGYLGNGLKAAAKRVLGLGEATATWFSTTAIDAIQRGIGIGGLDFSQLGKYFGQLGSNLLGAVAEDLPAASRIGMYLKEGLPYFTAAVTRTLQAWERYQSVVKKAGEGEMPSWLAALGTTQDKYVTGLANLRNDPTLFDMERMLWELTDVPYAIQSPNDIEWLKTHYPDKATIIERLTQHTLDATGARETLRKEKAASDIEQAKWNSLAVTALKSKGNEGQLNAFRRWIGSIIAALKSQGVVPNGFDEDNLGYLSQILEDILGELDNWDPDNPLQVRWWGGREYYSGSLVNFLLDEMGRISTDEGKIDSQYFNTMSEFWQGIVTGATDMTDADNRAKMNRYNDDIEFLNNHMQGDWRFWENLMKKRDASEAKGIQYRSTEDFAYREAMARDGAKDKVLEFLLRVRDQVDNWNRSQGKTSASQKYASAFDKLEVHIRARLAGHSALDPLYNRLSGDTVIGDDFTLIRVYVAGFIQDPEIRAEVLTWWDSMVYAIKKGGAPPYNKVLEDRVNLLLSGGEEAYKKQKQKDDADAEAAEEHEKYMHTLRGDISTITGLLGSIFTGLGKVGFDTATLAAFVKGLTDLFDTRLGDMSLFNDVNQRLDAIFSKIIPGMDLGAGGRMKSLTYNFLQLLGRLWTNNGYVLTPADKKLMDDWMLEITGLSNNAIVDETNYHEEQIAKEEEAYYEWLNTMRDNLTKLSSAMKQSLVGLQDLGFPPGMVDDYLGIITHAMDNFDTHHGDATLLLSLRSSFSTLREAIMSNIVPGMHPEDLSMITGYLHQMQLLFTRVWNTGENLTGAEIQQLSNWLHEISRLSHDQIKYEKEYQDQIDADAAKAKQETRDQQAKDIQLIEANFRIASEALEAMFPGWGDIEKIIDEEMDAYAEDLRAGKDVTKTKGLNIEQRRARIHAHVQQFFQTALNSIPGQPSRDITLEAIRLIDLITDLQIQATERPLNPEEREALNADFTDLWNELDIPEEQRHPGGGDSPMPNPDYDALTVNEKRPIGQGPPTDSNVPSHSFARPITDGKPMPETFKDQTSDLAFQLTELSQDVLNKNVSLRNEVKNTIANQNRKKFQLNKIGSRAMKENQIEIENTIPRLEVAFKSVATSVDSYGRLGIDIMELPVTMQVDNDKEMQKETEHLQLFNQVNEQVDKTEEQIDGQAEGDEDVDADQEIGLQATFNQDNSANVTLHNVDLSRKLPPLDPTMPMVLQGGATQAMVNLIQTTAQQVQDQDASVDSMARLYVRVGENLKTLIGHLKMATHRVNGRMSVWGGIAARLTSLTNTAEKWDMVIDAMMIHFTNAIKVMGLKRPWVGEEGVASIEKAGESQAQASSGNKNSNTDDALNYKDNQVHKQGNDEHNIMQSRMPNSARANFYSGGRATVAQSKDEAMLQEMMFNTFGFVQPNGYLGPNKIHQDNERNDRIRHEAPLALPRFHEQVNGIRNNPKELDDMLPNEFMCKTLKGIGIRAAKMDKMRSAKRQSATALIDDTNMEQSSSGLYWVKPTPMHFEVQTQFRTTATKDPAGVELNKRGFKNKQSCWWNPFIEEPQKKRRKVTLAERFQRCNKYYDSMM